jgi:RimJ/RimL family protein N-acetyltransferase
MASLRYGFEELGLDLIISIAVPENLASRRVMEKLGMTLRGETHFKGSDVVWYAVERQVWETSGA